MEYHHDRFVDNSLLIFKKDQLVALLPANRVGDTLYSHQGLSYGGLIVSKDVKFNDALSCFHATLKYLFNEGLKDLELKLIPRIYQQLPSDELNYLLFKVNAILKRCDILSVIDHLNKLHIVSNNRKRGLKRALNNELLVKEVNEFSSFWDEILTPNLNSTHNVSPVHTLEEINQLKHNFPNNIKQFNVYDNTKIVAGATIFETERTAHVQYISANERKQELGSLDILFHTLINEVYKTKPYFDFGISNENQGQQINRGLLEWKESFGARSIVQEFYTVSTKNYVKLENVEL